jgi:hypothetical protein
MNTRTLIERSFTALAIAAALSGAAQAQADATQRMARADAMAAPRDAHATGWMPSGEASVPPQPMHSTKTREQRKAETLEANKNGGLGSPGASAYRSHNIAPREATRNTTQTRAERKSVTLQAARDGKLLPHGEAEFSRN